MLGQCSHFLTRHRRITPVPAWDTAGAAREVAELGDPTRAAAGTHRAAQRFELQVLLEHIEDRPDSQLRFVAVAREGTAPPPGVPARTAVLCVLPHAAGTLIAAFRRMAEAGFNVSHLQSRPTREPWRYQFFLEFEHPAGDPRVEGALAGLRENSEEYRCLGTYPRWEERGLTSLELP
jgi:prephenate dehydratase